MDLSQAQQNGSGQLVDMYAAERSGMGTRIATKHLKGAQIIPANGNISLDIGSLAANEVHTAKFLRQTDTGAYLSERGSTGGIELNLPKGATYNIDANQHGATIAVRKVDGSSVTLQLQGDAGKMLIKQEGGNAMAVNDVIKAREAAIMAMDGDKNGKVNDIEIASYAKNHTDDKERIAAKMNGLDIGNVESLKIAAKAMGKFANAAAVTAPVNTPTAPSAPSNTASR